MYKRILVPAKAPSEVEPLIRFAGNLLEADGEIRLLHVIPTTTLPEVAREWRRSVNIVVPAHETAASLDLRVEPEVKAATDVPGEILESAETADVEAILMTLTGDRRSRNPFVGHTASGILHHAPCDVLILNPLALAGDRIPRVLVPTFRPSASPKAMRLAEELSIRSGGVPVITIELGARPAGGGSSEPEEETSARGIPMRHTRAFFSESLLGRRRRLPEILLQAAQRERFGLLVVSGEEDGAEGTLLTRRVVEDLFRLAPCPVVALRV